MLLWAFCLLKATTAQYLQAARWWQGILNQNTNN